MQVVALILLLEILSNKSLMKKLFASLVFVFIATSAFAELMCDTHIQDYVAIYEKKTTICDMEVKNIFATYEPYTYDCPSGYYLPANTLGCKPCPNGFTCPGGTFDFNPDSLQGINVFNSTGDTMNNMCAYNIPNSFFATYEPNVHECAHGEYLPANVDGCMPCLNDNYCPGGVYVFNETQNQGLAPCPDAHPFAPGGMWLESQCGRKLHVGDDVLYLHSAPAVPTVKRLYVRFNDVVYSANATEKDFAPATMAERATRALHVLIDGVEYLIHDDSAR